jgi:hypothetical protein
LALQSTICNRQCVTVTALEHPEGPGSSREESGDMRRKRRRKKRRRKRKRNIGRGGGP